MNYFKQCELWIIQFICKLETDGAKTVSAGNFFQWLVLGCITRLANWFQNITSSNIQIHHRN